jgi:DNA-binding CsgD family transcriptional regulator
MEVEHQEQPQQQTKHQHILWRRQRVAELSAQGRTEREVATILKVSLGTVSRDISYLNRQARDNLRFHIGERLPAQYRECQNGLNQVLKIAWNTVLLENGPGPNRLQALSLIGDIYRYQMELSVNAGIIEQAIHFVSQKKEQLGNTLHNNNNNEESETKDKTTSTVF